MNTFPKQPPSNTAAPIFDWKKSFDFLNSSKNSVETAKIEFRNLLFQYQNSPKSSPLTLAILLWKLKENSTEDISEFLEMQFPILYEIHEHLYENFDSKEECLIAFDNIQSVLFNTLFIWANEGLMKIGGFLNEDISEIMYWQENGIFSMNQKMWNQDLCGYQDFDLEKNEQISVEKPIQFIPIAAGIPGPDKAFDILDLLVYPESYVSAEPIFQWMLYCGLMVYETEDFVEVAENIKQNAPSFLSL